MRKKVCSKCKIEKTEDKFYKRSDRKLGLKPECIKCAKIYARSEARKKTIFRYRHTDKYKEQQSRYNRGTGKEKRKGYTLFYRFGITLERFKEILVAQHGNCAVCGGLPTHGRGLVVDHNHITGKIRELLCDQCNKGLGLFKEDTVVLMRAIQYLHKHA